MNAEMMSCLKREHRQEWAFFVTSLKWNVSKLIRRGKFPVVVQLIPGSECTSLPVYLPDCVLRKKKSLVNNHICTYCLQNPECKSEVKQMLPYFENCHIRPCLAPAIDLQVFYMLH